jgi:aminomethyltransferase
MRRTSLYPVHQQLGAKLVEFGGWEMPLYYSGIIQEHLAVRKAAGIFDISHMGEFLISGRNAAAFLNRMLTNEAGKLSVGAAQYTLICNQNGGVVDDTYLYRVEEQEFLLIVNASRIEADFDWLNGRLRESEFAGGVMLVNVSAEMGAAAVQGPRAKEFISKVFGKPESQEHDFSVEALKKNQVARVTYDSAQVWIARTGYTGEDGFEIVGPAAAMPKLWNALIEVGRPYGLVPAGLGARDTLRTEMCYPLYGHELDEATTPIDAGLGFFVSMEKGDFIGRGRLMEQKSRGPEKRLIAFRTEEKSAPPRPGYPVWSSGEASTRMGTVTSGTQSPSLGCGIGLAYVNEPIKAGGRIEIEIRGKKASAIVVGKPIYRKLS